jgi:hypothetical protein
MSSFGNAIPTANRCFHALSTTSSSSAVVNLQPAGAYVGTDCRCNKIYHGRFQAKWVNKTVLHKRINGSSPRHFEFKSILPTNRSSDIDCKTDVDSYSWPLDDSYRTPKVQPHYKICTPSKSMANLHKDTALVIKLYQLHSTCVYGGYSETSTRIVNICFSWKSSRIASLSSRASIIAVRSHPTLQSPSVWTR